MRRIASAVFVGSVLVAAASAGGAEPSKKIPDRFTVRCFRTAAPAGPFSAIEPSVALFLQAGQRGHVSFSEPTREASPTPSADGRKDAPPRKNADSRVTVHVSVVAQSSNTVTIDAEIERTDRREVSVSRPGVFKSPEKKVVVVPSRHTHTYRIQYTLTQDEFGGYGLILPTAADAADKPLATARQASHAADDFPEIPQGDWITLHVFPRFSDGLVIAPTTDGKFARRTAALDAINKTGTACMLQGVANRRFMIGDTPVADLLETTGQLADYVYDYVPHRLGLPEALALLGKCVEEGWLSRAEGAILGYQSATTVELWDSPVLMESLAALERLSPEEKADLSVIVHAVGGPDKPVDTRLASLRLDVPPAIEGLYGIEPRIDPPPAAPPAK